MTNDNVKKPPYYTSHPSGVECRDITRWMNFNLGSAFKYIWRADLKGNSIEDLEKARDCLDDEIKRRRPLMAVDMPPPATDQERATSLAAVEALKCPQ